MTQNVRIPDDPYAEGTPLTMAFGDQPKTLILASLLSEADRKIKIDDLSRLTGIKPVPLTGHLDDLHSDDLVIQSRNNDAELLYQINIEHPATEYMAKLEEALLDHWYEVEGEVQ
jgi:DNA-binding HxlR family transcriptional regulator